MTNIWELLLMTLTASLAALLILFIKRILADKLSPRWQYGIWCLLALRIILPVRVSGRYILLPLALWIETLKFRAESALAGISAYSAPFTPVGNAWFLPSVSGQPKSITDWFFIIYIAGIILFLAVHILSYIRLRLLLRKGDVPEKDTLDMIAGVCEKYSLAPCHAVEIKGISSAFVCGFLKPVLALPEGAVTDEKVILHELLHLKYKDALQGLFWTLLRALNWCNPLMHYIFNQIGNDMEALCDQRVLERIEGEERRDYGKILLSMANDKYARAFGTTSLSNGGKNIARRIQCIARFKKYPKGMALVSVCIGILLLQPILIGTPVYAMGQHNVSAGTNDQLNLHINMADVRLNRCSTMAGAIDTYAKGIIKENGLYIAAASPISKQEDLMNKMLQARADGWIYTHLENGLNGDTAQYPSQYSTPWSNGYYSIFNIERIEEGKSAHTAQLAIYMEYYQHTEEEIAQGMPVYYKDDETGAFLPAIALYTLTLDTEGSGWVVTECSQPEIIIAEQINYVSNMMVYDALEPVAVYSGQGKHGTITAPVYCEYYIAKPKSSQQTIGFGFWTDTVFDTSLQPDAQFEKVDTSFLATYDFTGSAEELASIDYVTLENMICEEESHIPAEGERMNESTGPAINHSSGGSSSDGWSYIAHTYQDGEAWDGHILDRNANRYMIYETEIRDYFKMDTMPAVPLPAALVSNCYMRGMETDYIISREVK